MSAVPVLGFAVVAALAIAFAAAPVWRMPNKKARALLMAAIAFFTLGIGVGTYYILGRPHLAMRAAQGLNTREINGLIPYLIERTRKAPNDARAWRFLGQAYIEAADPGQASKAFARAIELSGKGDPDLDAAYGEALVMQSGGAVPQEAEDAFSAALAVDPHNGPARFYLGLARAGHGDRPGAIALWRSLLADTPSTAPLHQILVDRIAMLTSQAERGSAPNPKAMVAMLAARLKADPDDALGWVRLIHAYTVLGEMDQARSALASARKTFAGNKDAQTAFDTIAKDIKP